MWSLTSLRKKRISSFRKFRLLPPKDFFDSIDPLRKSGGRKCCDAQHGFFNDVVGCYPRLEEST